ncbi:hypothetical protein ACS0TY_000114 [Phlomoides rotata]
MMFSETLLLFTASSSLLILLQFLQASHAYLLHAHVCTPSACGIIRNISFPFRLKHDPQICGDSKYELSCEFNVTTLHLASQKFQVKAIDYQKNRIRVSDASITSDLCSFPQFSVHAFNFSNNYPYSISDSFIFHKSQVASPINFMSCPYQLNDSSFFTELASDCGHSSRYSYVKVGHMNASDVRQMCRVDRISLTSWKFRDLKNVSVAEIHESLLYGFQMSWFSFRCIECKPGEWECTDIEHPLKCREGFRVQLHMTLWDVILMLIVAVVVPGFIGAKLIIGITYFWLMFILSNTNWIFNTLEGGLLKLLLIPGICIAARFIILFPCFMRILLYKFRRRNMSVFDEIENFLQSDNCLVPIRYSYSDIKRMTRGFREKLGQGGYGTVYKGKLRSAHDVAVKLLGKPGGNGQDFMNEIGTIGRIHHVNVVKLVGYCAEGSKRALIFDFMPNGSLDKYLYSRENTNFLSWERKHEIAIGVARGIEYLHKGCDIQILHFDIKPHNILLDDKFTPKITDFGLAKFFSTDKTVVTMTAIRGTIGYVAPELINRGFGEVSYKADVYSFGMLLMEMVGLNRDLKMNNQASSQYFPCWIYDCFDQGHDIEFGVTNENIDDDNMSDTYKSIAKKMTIVALWCIQTSPGDRPSMNKVVEMLEAPVERLRVPNRPPQSAQVAVNYENQSWSTYSTNATSLLDQDAASCFEITIED